MSNELFITDKWNNCMNRTKLHYVMIFFYNLVVHLQKKHLFLKYIVLKMTWFLFKNICLNDIKICSTKIIPLPKTFPIRVTRLKFPVYQIWAQKVYYQDRLDGHKIFNIKQFLTEPRFLFKKSDKIFSLSLKMNILLALMTCLFFGSAVSISFIDIVMEEWQDWKLSHRNHFFDFINFSIFIR